MAIAWLTTRAPTGALIYRCMPLCVWGLSGAECFAVVPDPVGDGSGRIPGQVADGCGYAGIVAAVADHVGELRNEVGGRPRVHARCSQGAAVERGGQKDRPYGAGKDAGEAQCQIRLGQRFGPGE